MTDLMTGLVLVFIVMFFYTFISGHLESVRNESAKENASKLLQESLNDKNIQADVNPVSGVVEISDLELFEVNSFTLSPKGKAYLEKFTPSYFNFIFSNDYLSKNVNKIGYIILDINMFSLNDFFNKITCFLLILGLAVAVLLFLAACIYPFFGL